MPLQLRAREGKGAFFPLFAERRRTDPARRAGGRGSPAREGGAAPREILRGSLRARRRSQNLRPPCWLPPAAASRLLPDERGPDLGQVPPRNRWASAPPEEFPAGRRPCAPRTRLGRARLARGSGRGGGAAAGQYWSSAVFGPNAEETPELGCGPHPTPKGPRLRLNSTGAGALG